MLDTGSSRPVNSRLGFIEVLGSHFLSGGRSERIIALKLNPQGDNMSRRTCDTCGKDKPLEGGKTARKVISHARTARTTMNTASSAGIRLDSSRRYPRCATA